MMRSRLLATVTALWLLLPLQATAYTPPDEVLGNPHAAATGRPRTDSFSARERRNEEAIRRLAEAEARLAAQERMAEEAAHAAAGSSSSASAVSSEQTVIAPTGESVTLNVNAATLRALLRLQSRRNQPAVAVHPGAPLDEMPARVKPLAPTGPEMWLLGLALIGAVGWTMHRARAVGRQ